MKFVPAPQADAGTGLPHEVLIVAVLVLALVAVGWSMWRKRSGKASNTVVGLRNCRWKKARRREGILRSWVCRSCQVTAFTSTRRPPIECKRGLEGGL